MDITPHLPRTLIEAVRFFADPDVCLEFMVQLRWPNGVSCPTCGRTDVRFLASRRLWECKTRHPRRQFSVKAGTLLEDSPLGLDKWLPAIWLIANCKNGVSSYEVARALGITQKSAWFLLHRVRVAMEMGSFEKLSGEIEADESFIGGLARNMHPHKREAKIKGTGGSGKAIVMGVLERKGEVRASVVDNTRKRTVQGKVREHVAPGSAVFTDSLRSYDGLSADYVHETVDHAVEFVRGRVHTNGLENFWSLLKRTLKGTYVSVSPWHLQSYVGEQVFRYNERQDGAGDAGRFLSVAGNVTGKRLTYKALKAAAKG